MNFDKVSTKNIEDFIDQGGCGARITCTGCIMYHLHKVKKIRYDCHFGGTKLNAQEITEFANNLLKERKIKSLLE